MDDFIKWVSITARQTALHMDRELAPYGLNASQYMYVVRICERPGLTQDQFLQLFHINPSNVTRAMMALEKQGFLERRPNPRDRRTFRLYPTPKAQEVYPNIVHLRRDWQDALLADLAPDTRAEVEQALRTAALRAVESNREEDPDHAE